MVPHRARLKGVDPTKSELRCHIGIDAHTFLREHSPSKGVGDLLTIIVKDYMNRKTLSDKIDRVELLVPRFPHPFSWVYERFSECSLTPNLS